MNKVVVFLTLALFSCGSSKDITKENLPLMDYESSDLLSRVLDKAEKEEKIVFVDVYTDWCLPCKVMDAEVFGDKATADFMNENFINYKVNGEMGEGPDLTLIYQVKGFPTLLFLDSKGRVLERYDGSVGIQKFNIMAENALAKQSNPEVP